MRVSQDLSIPLGIAAVLLRHCHWSPERVKKEWSEHGEKLRRAVGLPSSPDDVSGPKELNHGSSNRQCNICFSSAFAAGKTMISAGCSHYYCNECWRRFISVEVVGRGTQCLSLRCPDPCCQMPVIQELVDKVGNRADRDRYARFAFWSYVDDSGGRIKWCPGPGCDRAVEFLGANDVAVACDCKHVFCWSCGEEPHRPLSCDMACLWLDTISSRSDEVLTLTKRCPKCRRMIENERGKHYVTCCAPCCHRFWWNCLHPLGGNRTDGCAFGCLWYISSETIFWRYSDRYKKTLATKKDEKQQAMASYYYQLWASNHASLQKALEDMDELKESWLLNMANEVGIQVTDLDFLIKAYEEIAECRRVMRWVYPYGYYYLDEKRDGDKCKQLDHLQKEANFSLGRLLDSAVEGKFKLYSVEIEAFADAYQALKTDIMDLARETRHKVEKLVKAVKTDFED
uniref:RBR-type E3 ubiquitin transferase n=1 Tax=Oryza punctata TaxID=4537 RepID=A0A0E0L7G1_ORYPU